MYETAIKLLNILSDNGFKAYIVGGYPRDLILNRESFDIATSRAVANLSTLAEYLLPLVKVGGICICMKGSEINEELVYRTQISLQGL